MNTKRSYVHTQAGKLIGYVDHSANGRFVPTRRFRHPVSGHPVSQVLRSRATLAEALAMVPVAA